MEGGSGMKPVIDKPPRIFRLNSNVLHSILAPTLLYTKNNVHTNFCSSSCYILL